MNSEIEKDMLSEDIQKKFEDSPIYLLDKIRGESKNIALIFSPKEPIKINNEIFPNNLLKEKDSQFLKKKLFESQNKKIFPQNKENDLIYNTNYFIKNNNINNTFFNVNLLQTNTGNFSQNINISNNFQINSLNKGVVNLNKYLIEYDVEKIIDKLKNYWGSIHLQNKINFMSDYEISLLYLNILPKIGQVMCLEYGNYFFNKLIKRLNPSQKLGIYQAIEQNFLFIAKNKNGTHSIQSLIDEIRTPNEQNVIDNLINSNILSLFNDKNAYHIIMKLIIERPENQRNYINLFIINNIEKISINPFGSYCVNKFIANNVNLNVRLLLLKNIQSKIDLLFYHKYSCSILFVLLKYFDINYCKFIFQEIKSRIYKLINNPVSLLFTNKIIYLILKNKFHYEI